MAQKNQEQGEYDEDQDIQQEEIDFNGCYYGFYEVESFLTIIQSNNKDEQIRCTRFRKEQRKRSILKAEVLNSNQPLLKIQYRRIHKQTLYLIFIKAVQTFQILVRDGQIKTKEQMIKFIEDIEIPCYSNLAICNLKLKEYRQCIHFASKVIEQDPGNIKSLYRRGMAHLHLSEFDDARKDFKLAFSIDPQNKEVQLAFEQLQIKKSKADEKQKQLSKKMLDNLDYADKVEESKKNKKGSNKEKGGLGIINKIYKMLVPDFNQILYNAKVTSLVFLNLISERMCNRRIPSQYFSKNK